MSATPFTRPTILAAVTFLNARLAQADFNHLALHLGLENEIPSDTTLSVAKKSTAIWAIKASRAYEHSSGAPELRG